MSARRTDLPQLPSEKASSEAASAARALSSLFRGRRSSAFRLTVSPEGSDRQESVVVPREALDLLMESLAQLANGNAVSVVPVQAELTTQQAADLLNVSRPYFVELLESGRIPFRLVGTRRRVRTADLLAYQRAEEEKRKATLAELAAEAQRLGLDD